MNRGIGIVWLAAGLALLAWLGSGSVACSGNQNGGSDCQADQDCPSGRYCDRSSGECIYDCTYDGECPASLECSGRGRCECLETNNGVEACDGQDNDCDGQIDEGFDRDQDGYSACDLDCDDQDPTTFDGAEELCDGRDNDCDGTTDADLVGDPCTSDGPYGSCDGLDRCVDGQWVCDAPEAAPEACDTVDNDCDGLTDEFAEPSGDCETGFDLSDGLDNNCDGLTDEPGGCMVRAVVGDIDVYIDKFESTVFEEWDCTGRRYGESDNDYPGNWPAEDQPASINLYACSLPGLKPSRYLSLFQARRACQAQGKRLCTKAEWSVACGGTALQDFAYGDSYIEDICNTFSAGFGDTVETGSMEGCVSPTGAYDMSGNLWEWVDAFCPWDISQQSVQGGSFVCEICDDLGSCVDCDMNNPEHLDQIAKWHKCHYPGGYEVCIANLTAQSIRIGFRCCYDPP